MYNNYTCQYYFPRDIGVHCEDYGIAGKLNFNEIHHVNDTYYKTSM